MPDKELKTKRLLNGSLSGVLWMSITAAACELVYRFVPEEGAEPGGYDVSGHEGYRLLVWIALAVAAVCALCAVIFRIRLLFLTPPAGSRSNSERDQ